ncbi:hypothetical protein [Chryseobacterium lacus]|uniref:hypothetical protein n=1 Tax=Chryseobacterium lacus TaxID=2058346 RepID=UPI000F88D577|nr:hypothetical protein [Chryseobacterium lacus]RST27705.1 hypothetical protein EIZ46_05205 [Chryseobacterium lacus]
MNWKLFFNPFSKFSEKALLISGILFLVVGSFIGYYFGVTYDGIFDVHISTVTLIESLTENVINVVILSLLLFIAGIIINSKTRIIDVLNVALISRFPIYLAGLFANNQRISEISEQLIDSVHQETPASVSSSDMMILMLFSAVLILLLAYQLMLMVFGFKTAVNARKWQHWLLFAFALIAAEMISKAIIHFI